MHYFLFSMVYDVGRPFYFRPVSKVCITAFPFFNKVIMHLSKRIKTVVQLPLELVVDHQAMWHNENRKEENMYKLFIMKNLLRL